MGGATGDGGQSRLKGGQDKGPPDGVAHRSKATTEWGGQGGQGSGVHHTPLHGMGGGQKGTGVTHRLQWGGRERESTTKGETRVPPPTEGGDKGDGGGVTHRLKGGQRGPATGGGGDKGDGGHPHPQVKEGTGVHHGMEGN